MKTSYLIKTLLGVVAIVALMGGFLATAAFVNVQRQIRWHERMAVLLDRVYYDQRVGGALKQISEGDVRAAAQRLDLALCSDILRLNSQLELADDYTRSYVEASLRQLSHVRPKTVALSGASSPDAYDGDQIAAEKLLELAATAEKRGALIPITQTPTQSGQK